MTENLNIKILIVDDYPIIRRVMRHFLKNAGYSDVEQAENCMEALAQLRADDFQLIITDCNMPDMSGIELAAEIRADSQLKNIPILMVTGSAFEKTIVDALQAGINDLIVKPFTAQTLSEKIDKVLAGQQFSQA